MSFQIGPDKPIGLLIRQQGPQNINLQLDGEQPQQIALHIARHSPERTHCILLDVGQQPVHLCGRCA